MVKIENLDEIKEELEEGHFFITRNLNWDRREGGQTFKEVIRIVNGERTVARIPYLPEIDDDNNGVWQRSS